jgi:N-6 DNA Methylase
VYDPCCGSAGMFVQSERFVEAHGGQKTDISIFGQESNLGAQPADSFLRSVLTASPRPRGGTTRSTAPGPARHCRLLQSRDDRGHR